MKQGLREGRGGRRGGKNLRKEGGKNLRNIGRRGMKDKAEDEVKGIS